MKAEFWHERWQSNRIGFHNAEVNQKLARNLSRLTLDRGSQIFVPLCGKSRDIGWLLKQGLYVVAIELSEIAVQQLFQELGIVPKVTELDLLKRFSSPQLEVFVGDIFDLTGELTGKIDAVYDRAALIALPVAMRQKYADTVSEISGYAPQLLISIDYDQAEMDGPPFSVPRNEIAALYGTRYSVALLESTEVEGGLKGICPAHEIVWHLTPADR